VPVEGPHNVASTRTDVEGSLRRLRTHRADLPVLPDAMDAPDSDYGRCSDGNERPRAHALAREAARAVPVAALCDMTPDLSPIMG
jgi:hypothetical protein